MLGPFSITATMISSRLYGNYTIFGLHSEAERYFWASFHTLVVFSSLIGDPLILYASFQKDAFKVNRFIVAIIQHLAASNMTYSIFVVLPEAIALFSDSWVLGDTICYISVYTYHYIYLVSMLLIATLATSKFLLLKSSQHRFWSKKNAHLLCSTIWVFPLITPILMLVLNKDDVYFDFRIYNCNYWATADAWAYIVPVIAFFFLFAPNVIIVGITISILKYLAGARKSARRVHGVVLWQGTLAVTLTAVIYCISSLPMAVYQTAERFVDVSESHFRIHVHRIGFFLAMINIMSNVYIYALTIKTFRKFLLSKVLCMESAVSSQDSQNSRSVVASHPVQVKRINT